MEEEREYRGHVVGLGSFAAGTGTWKGHWRVRILDDDRSGLAHFADVLVGQQAARWGFASREDARDQAFECAQEAVDKLVDRDANRRPHFVVSMVGGDTTLSIEGFLSGEEVFRVEAGDSIAVEAHGRESAWVVRTVKLENGSPRTGVWPSDTEAAEHADEIRAREADVAAITSGSRRHQFWLDTTTAPFWATPYPPLFHVASTTEFEG